MKPGNIKRKAFTLVEILIVICVISILFVVLVSRVDFATDKSRQAGVQNDFHAMQSALHVIALENNSFMGDITQLAAELNKNLDSELSVRVENGVIKTDALDPWGSEYVLEYDKPIDTNGRVTLLSPGPDTTLRTQDDIKSEVVIKLDNGKTNIVIDNNPQEVGGGEHTCLFNRMIKESKYIKTQGNCITPTVYFYSCSCGAVGTSTFHGSLALDEHIGTPRIEYQTFDANHNVLSYCSSCNVLISTVPEAHNMVGEECTICHKVIHNHNYNLELVAEAAKASPATCTAKATYYYSCQCGALSTDTFEYGEVLSHTFTANSTQYKASDATCSVRATYYKTCSSCGIQGSETFESGLTDGPHPGTTIPTYVKLNETQHTKKNICTACSNEVSSTTENHNLNENNTCSLCDEHVHNYTVKHVDNKHIATPASCTEAASYYYSCTCDENGTTTFNDGTPLSHNESAEIAEDRYFKSAATCLVPTTYYKSCTGCGLEGTSTFTVGQALGHIEQIVSGYAATCTTTGLTDGVTCSRCNEIVKMQVIINALGHKEIITTGKEATCTTAGTTDKITCSRCNTVITNSTTIPALGHDIVYDEGYAATCSMPGLTTGERCSRCDYKVTQQEIAKLPHTEVVDNAVSVTCTTNGYTEGKHCSVCGEVTMPQETIYATGHAEVKLNAIAATCTSSGLTEGSQCSKCGSVLKAQTSIAAKGHTVVQDSAIAATCTNEGRTAGSHCSVCSVIISGTSTIAKLDHDYDVEITNPQCVVPGSITYTCQSCGHIYSDPLDAIGHIDTNSDNLCDICNDKTYALNGKWRFNNTIVPPTDYVYQKINFTYPGMISTDIMVGIMCENNTSDDWIIVDYRYVDSTMPDQQTQSSEVYCDRWSNTDYQVVDFGNKPQSVSQEFYEWFVANATPYEEATYALNGKWKLNLAIANEELSTNQSINFTINDVEYSSINYQARLYVENDWSGYYHQLSYDDLLVWTFGWTNDEIINSIIDFGNTSQEVSQKFYEWFVANATPYEEATYALNGTWIFNETLTLPNDSISEDVVYINDYEYYDIFISSSGVRFYQYDAFVYDTEMFGGWINDDCRVIKFVDTQVVSKEFYEWFTTNATPYNEPTYTLSGTWIFNEIPQKPDSTITQNINFTINHPVYGIVKYDNIDIPDDTKTEISLGNYFAHSPIEGWKFDRIIYFGSDPQSVSKEFYEWFTTNATQCYTLSGIWTWKNNIFIDVTPTLTQNINFTSNNQSYSQISTVINSDRSQIKYDNEARANASPIPNPYDGMTYGLYFVSDYRTIDFGNTKQPVSEEFYFWFIAHASTEQTVQISGTWLWNETISFIYPNITIPSFDEDVNFIADQIQYTSINFGSEFGINYYSSSEFINIFSNNSIGWQHTREIDFGDSQYVSIQFYEFLRKNATQISNNSCSHNYTSTIITESTCKNPGVKLKVCILCQQSVYETIPKLEHTLQTISAIAATCTTPGKSEGQQCSVCNTIIVQPSIIAALGHNLQTQSITNATCLTDGLSVEQCTRCGEVNNTILKATGHIDMVKDGICDVCDHIIEYIMHIDNVEYKFTYNMTWGEWFASKYNTTDLIQVGNSFIKISKDGKSGYKLSATKAIMNGNSLSIEVYTPQASDLVEEFKYQLAKLSFAKTTLVIVTDDGVFSTEYDKLGITTYMDAANKLKDGSAYAVIYNEKVFYSYDDAVADVTIKRYVNGYYYNTLNKTYCLITGAASITFNNSTNPKWYIADSNGDPINNTLFQGKTYTITDDVDLIFMSTYAPELTFYDNVIDQPLKNAEILLYDKTTGQLINKFNTNTNGIAVISGLKPGTYICQSKYETFEISLINDNWSYQRMSQRYEFTLTSTVAGKLYVYDMNNNLLNYVQDNSKTYKLCLFVGEYYIRLNDQDQVQILTIDENGNLTLSPLQ